MSDYVMTVGGETIPTGETFGVRNPATGEVFVQAPECSREQLDAAFDSASKALRDWKNDESARRTALLKRWRMYSWPRPGRSLRFSPPSKGSHWRTRTSRSSPPPSGVSTSPTSRRRRRSSRTTSRPTWRWCVAPSASWQPSLRGTFLSRWPSGRSLRRSWRATPWCSNPRPSRPSRRSRLGSCCVRCFRPAF
jgi:hypothetical protein